MFFFLTGGGGGPRNNRQVPYLAQQISKRLQTLVLAARHWAFPEIFRNPLEDNHFQKSYPLYLIFHHPTPLEFHTIFSRTPLEFHGNPLSSIMTPLEFSNFKHNLLEFSRFSFLRPSLEFPLSSTGGSGKFLEKPNLTFVFLP